MAEDQYMDAVSIQQKPYSTPEDKVYTYSH